MIRLLLILPLATGSVIAQLPPTPPTVKVFRGATMTQGEGAKALITQTAVIAPRVLVLTWNHPDSDVTFNVYHSYIPSLKSMTLLATTNEKRYAVTPSFPAEFFGVKAVRNGIESEWATK